MNEATLRAKPCCIMLLEFSSQFILYYENWACAPEDLKEYRMKRP
jgi:hypothetical protein